MKIHITKVIEDRSPAVVVQALEKCLKQEAWEIRRFDTRVVALGIGTSRNAVRLSDNATFDLDSTEGVTRVQVEAEYQHMWFLSEETQDDTVHARFESIFANMRAALDLPSERLIRQSEAEESPKPFSEPTTTPDNSMTPIESDPPLRLESAVGEMAQQTSASEFERLSPAPPTSSNSSQAPRYLLPSSDIRKPFSYRAASLIGAFVIVVMFAVFWLSNSRAHLLSGKAPGPSPARYATQDLSSQSVLRSTPLPSTLIGREDVSNGPNGMPASSAANLEDPRRWLEQWAAAQRTSDAKSQASFYADEVRPYLALHEASRDAVYQDKQKSILNRERLWTFKIEDLSVQRESANMATVLLKKHFMTQKGSVEVSEQRISSLLTLKRTRDGWQITGERDLSPGKR